MEASDQKKRREKPAEAAPSTSSEVDVSEKWEGKLADLLLVNVETDRELADVSRRDAAMQGRATILIGAASLVGVLRLGGGFDWLVLLNLVLNAAAAVCGVVVLFPRSADAPNPRRMWDAIYSGASGEEALHHVIRVKLDALADADAFVDRQASWIGVGFILLAVTIVTTGVVGLMPAA